MKSFVAKDLFAVSENLQQYLKFKFTEVQPKQADFVNAICNEIDDLAERIRRNEGLTMKVDKDSQNDETIMCISMTPHESNKAITENLAKKLNKMCRKKKLKVEVLDN